MTTVRGLEHTMSPTCRRHSVIFSCHVTRQTTTTTMMMTMMTGMVAMDIWHCSSCIQQLHYHTTPPTDTLQCINPAISSLDYTNLTFEPWLYLTILLSDGRRTDKEQYVSAHSTFHKHFSMRVLAYLHGIRVNDSLNDSLQHWSDSVAHVLVVHCIHSILHQSLTVINCIVICSHKCQ